MTSHEYRSAALYARSRELRSYVGLDDQQVQLAVSAWPLISPDLDLFVEDFYAEILQHEPARRVFTGMEQVMRLKGSLRHWIVDLFTSEHDEAFLARRWAVGLRHVQIGLEPVWVSAAMSRLRDQILQSIQGRFTPEHGDLFAVMSAITRLIDLDLAIIQDAYHAESVAKQLAEERDFAEGVIDTAQAVVMMVTGDGMVVRGNQFLAHQLGWDQVTPSDQDNLSVNCFELVSEDQRDEMRRFIASAARGDSPEPIETSLVVAQGPPPRVRWHARRYEDRMTIETAFAQKALLVLCVGQDITELSDAQLRLVRSERLAAIGQTMTGLAHESRNAFQRSQAALETLALELEGRPAAVKLVERIQRAHDHLLHLYEEVLQFARPVRLDLQTVSLAALIHQTWDHIRQASNEKPVTLAMEANSSAELRADPFALEQVFRNLLENAIEASRRDASIYVKFRDLWVGVDRCVEVEVRDFGIGMSEDAIERAFEPFYTTRSRGTGLGLPIARRLVESHGGTLELFHADPGVLAVVTLPLRARPVEYADATTTTDYRRAPALLEQPAANRGQ
jgi:signal transduction histidine kinase